MQSALNPGPDGSHAARPCLLDQFWVFNNLWALKNLVNVVGGLLSSQRLLNDAILIIGLVKIHRLIKGLGLGDVGILNSLGWFFNFVGLINDPSLLLSILGRFKAH